MKIIITLTIITVFLIMWALCKVASDSDDRMDK